MREEYTSLWDFLKKTPKNLWSVVIIWAMCLFMGIGAWVTELATVWRTFLTGFLITIMYLAVIRVKQIYDKVK